MFLYKINAKYKEKSFMITTSLICVKGFEQPFLSLLSADELRKYDLLKHPHRKFSFLYGRVSAKMALSNFFSKKKFADITIKNDILGKPYADINNVSISISHTDTMGGAAVCDREFPIGFDTEKIRSCDIAAVESMMTANEKMLPAIVTNYDNTDLYAVIWTAKEALGKLLGIGINTENNVLEISKIKKSGENYICRFTNFRQLKSFSWSCQEHICTIVCAEKYDLKIIDRSEKVYDIKK